MYRLATLGMGIGNPLVMSPIYNADGDISFRVRVCWDIISGSWEIPCADLQYRVLLSVTRNWGTYSFFL